MTNNIEKLYELAGVEKHKSFLSCLNCIRKTIQKVDEFGDEYTTCEHDEVFVFCPHAQDVYPSFTAEKQLELIKWLCKNTYRNYFKIIFDFQNKTWYMECDCCPTPNKRNFEESLAILTISIWKDLTDKQKEEIKEILK